MFSSLFWALFFTKPLTRVSRFAERTGKKRSEVLNARSDVVLLIVFLSSGSCWRRWQSSCWVNGLFEVRPHKSWTSVSHFSKVFRACKKRLTLCQDVFRNSNMFFLWQELSFVLVLVSLTYYSAIQCESESKPIAVFIVWRVCVSLFGFVWYHCLVFVLACFSLLPIKQKPLKTEVGGFRLKVYIGSLLFGDKWVAILILIVDLLRRSAHTHPLFQFTSLYFHCGNVCILSLSVIQTMTL